VNITLRQLSVFTATARLNRITLAAEELCMTQSAASQSIKELESVLGYQVFERFGRKLKINENGKAILSKATKMLDLQLELQQPLSIELQGSLKIAASVTISSYLMPKILADFVQLYPQVEPDLCISNSEEVIERLEAGKAHIGLIEAPLMHKYLSISPWRTDKLAVFCGINHPMAIQADMTIKLMGEQRWILREHGSGTRSVFVSAMQQQGGVISNSMGLARQEAIKQSVKANLGLGVLSLLSIQQELKLGIFKQLQTPLNLNRQFSIVESEHYQHNQVIITFRDFLRQMNHK
jgi:DNA-binding transcriptional LysR family regulator